MNAQPRIPEFEGDEVRRVELKISGAGGGGRPLHIGQDVIVVARATITGVNHVAKDGVVTRAHVAKVSEAWEIPDEMSPGAILADAKDAAGGDNGQLALDDEEG